MEPKRQKLDLETVKRMSTFNATLSNLQLVSEEEVAISRNSTVMDQRPPLQPQQVNESNDDVLGIDSLPDEMIVEIFKHLSQNQLGRIARVCKKWNALTKCPVLWRMVSVEIFGSSDKERNAQSFESFIDGLPSCVTFLKLDFSGRAGRTFLNLEKLCMKLHHISPNVEALNLDHCDIPTILPETINSCTQFLQGLKKLVLHSCQFGTYSVTEELQDNSDIEVLDLCYSKFSDFSKIRFSKLLSLKELRLVGTDADDSWFVSDASFLNQLHVLDLSWTYVTASTFRAIERHGQNLKELYLCRINLDVDDFNFNGPVFPHLQAICLYATGVTCVGLVSLLRSCPSMLSVYVDEDLARSFAEYPLVVANRCKPGIVKSIDTFHDHDVDYSHN